MSHMDETKPRSGYTCRDCGRRFFGEPRELCPRCAASRQSVTTQGNSMYCVKCGREIPEGWAYCAKCGTMVAEVPTATRAAAAPTPMRVAAAPKESTCDYPDCTLGISTRCSRCGRSFCTRHINLITGYQRASYVCDLCVQASNRAEQIAREEKNATAKKLLIIGIAMTLFCCAWAPAAPNHPAAGFFAFFGGGLGIILLIVGFVKRTSD